MLFTSLSFFFTLFYSFVCCLYFSAKNQKGKRKKKLFSMWEHFSLDFLVYVLTLYYIIQQQKKMFLCIFFFFYRNTESFILALTFICVTYISSFYAYRHIGLYNIQIISLTLSIYPPSKCVILLIQNENIVCVYTVYMGYNKIMKQITRQSEMLFLLFQNYLQQQRDKVLEKMLDHKTFIKINNVLIKYTQISTYKRFY